MKRIAILFPALLILALVALCSSCAMFGSGQSKPAEPYTYVGDKLMYPAVYTVIMGTIKNAHFDHVDFYGNQFEVSNIVFLDGVLECKADLTVKIQNGTVIYDYHNAKEYSQKSGTWDEKKSYIFNSPHDMDAKMTELIKGLMERDDYYERARMNALKDISFVTACMKDMNEIQLKDFIQNILGSITYTLTATVSDVTENSKPVNGVNYKYRVQCYIKDPSEKSMIMEHDLLFWYFTNNPSVIRYSKNSVINAVGKIVSGGRDITATVGYEFDVVELPAN